VWEERQRAREEHERQEQEFERQQFERERQIREREWQQYDRYQREHRTWRRGDRLPRRYLSREYRIDDYDAYDLRRPPNGHCWIKADDRLLLTVIATGVVIDVISSGGR
jgi:Ni/Co efflux regulator RcnB